MDNFIDLFSKYSLSDVLIIVFAVYLAFEFISGKIKQYKKDKNDSLVKFHKEQNKIEKHDQTIDDRLTKLEQYVGNDREQIRGLGTHLDEIEEQVKTTYDTLGTLAITVRDLRLETMRAKILDAVPKCIDLTSTNIGSEDYTNLFQIYTAYEKILQDNNLENSQVSLAMRMIKDSYRKRLAAELLTDYRYLPPEEISKKIRKADDAISWWNDNMED